MIAKKRFKRKRDYKQIFFSVFGGILVLTVMSFLIISNLRINQRRAELNSRIRFLEAELESVEKRNKDITAKFSEGSYNLEKALREEALLKKQGEKVVVITKEKERKDEEKKKRGFLKEVLEKLKF